MNTHTEQETLIANMQYIAKLAYILQSQGAAEMMKVIEGKANGNT